MGSFKSVELDPVQVEVLENHADIDFNSAGGHSLEAKPFST